MFAQRVGQNAFGKVATFGIGARVLVKKVFTDKKRKKNSIYSKTNIFVRKRQ